MTNVHRPRRERSAARIIVRSRTEDGRPQVLLFQDTDPGLPGSEWWVTPGGGVDPGEAMDVAALRELFEETGYRATTNQLRGPVATRLAVHGYSDQILDQAETFYLVDVDRFEVSTVGFTEKEKATLMGHGWFGAEDLAGMEVWPHHLADHLDWDGEPCVDWGTMEESTVPVEN